MDDYINQLLQDAGVPENTDPEVRDQLVSDLQTRATDLVNRRLVDSLSDSDAAELEVLLDKDTYDESRVRNFIDTHVPNVAEVTTAALVEFRALYLGDRA